MNALLLKAWFELARIRDESGLPIDLMYAYLQQNNRLPYATRDRVVTEDEFRQGIQDCMAIRQNRSPRNMNLTPEQVRSLREPML